MSASPSSSVEVGSARLDHFIWALLKYLIYNAKGLGLFSAHEVIAIQRALNRLIITACMFDIDIVQAPFDFQNILSMSLNIRGLALEAAGGLMHHHARIGQTEAHVLFARCEQQGTHGGGLTNAQG